MKTGCRMQTTALASVSLVLLCSCGGPAGVKDGAYRVQTKAVKDEPAAITRQYLIETASQRKLCTLREAGSNIINISPDSMQKQRTAKTEATLTVTMHGDGAARKVVFELVVNSPGGIGRVKEELPVPADADLRSILTEPKPAPDAGDVTAKTILLRAASGDKFVELSIE